MFIFSNDWIQLFYLKEVREWGRMENKLGITIFCNAMQQLNASVHKNLKNVASCTCNKRNTNYIFRKYWTGGEIENKDVEDHKTNSFFFNSSWLMLLDSTVQQGLRIICSFILDFISSRWCVSTFDEKINPYCTALSGLLTSTWGRDIFEHEL